MKTSLPTLKLTPLEPAGAEISGLDLSQSLEAGQIEGIRNALDMYAVVVFRDQNLDQHQQIELAKSFGPLDLGFNRVKRKPQRRLQYQELADISNLGADGQVVERTNPKLFSLLANQLWHSDSSFQRPRAKYSMLHAVEVPAAGGETEFADLRQAYDALPEWRKTQISNLNAVHYALHSRTLLGDTGYTEEQRQALPPVEWPLVQTDPRSGRKALFVGAHASHVAGMSLPEGRVLISDLIEHATQREFVYRHCWRPGDLVIWDNTTTAHRGRHYELAQRRELRRATTEEVQMSPEAAALAD